MHKNKSFSIMLTLILFIGLITGNFSNVKAEGIDTSLPQKFNLVISADQFQFGDTASITIETSEEEGNLGDNAYVAYRVKNGNEEVTREFQLVRDGKSYDVQFEVDETFESGLWEVDYVIVSNKGGQVVLYNDSIHNFTGSTLNHQDLSQANFFVEEIADYPLFKSASTDMSKAKLLDTVLLKVETVDKDIDLLDKAYASYIYKDENGTFTQEVTLHRSGKNIYEGEVVIDDTFFQGTWKLDYVVIKEKSGTTKISYNSDIHGNPGADYFVSMADANIQVEEDNIGPAIVHMEKELLDNITGTYRVTVVAEDEAGLNEKAWLKYTSSANGVVNDTEVELELKDGKYVGIFKRESLNSWKVDFLLLKDKLGNTSYAYNEDDHMINPTNFDALNVIEDDKIPSIKEMKISKNEVDGKYTLKVYPNADQSGLASTAYAMYEAQYEDSYIEKGIKLELINGVYVAKFTIDEYSLPLEWEMKFVIITDLNENKGVYFNNKNGDGGENFINMENVIFMSKGEDTEGPEFIDITLNEAIREDKFFVDVQIDAIEKDGELGSTAYIVFRDNLGNEKRCKVTLDGDSYRDSIDFSSNNKGDEWVVDYILLKDNKNNETIVYNASIHGQFEQSIDMSSKKVIFPKPKFKSISVKSNGKSTFDLGEEVEITLEVKKGLYDLGEKAEVMYFIDEEDSRKGVLLELTKVNDETYKGIFKAEKIEQLGAWKLFNIDMYDVKGNVSTRFDIRLPGFESYLESGDFIIGETVVYGISDDEIRLGRDFKESFVLKNYGEEDKEINVLVELKDKNNELISKSKAMRVVKAGGKEIVNVRMRMNPNAKYINIIVLDSEGNELYRIVDGLLLD